MSPILRRTATIAAVATALLVTGCAGRADVASSQTPLPTPTVAATATATATPTATPETSPTEASPAAAPEPSVAPEPTAAPEPGTVPSIERCTGADLALEYRPDPDASGAGSSAFDLVFTNTTAVTCTLAGIPGVYATDADGVRLGAVAAATGPNPDGLFSLIPGGQADVRVTWHSPGAFGCPVATSAYLVAEVVDAADPAVRAPASIEVCTDGTVFMEASTYTLLG
ncbi:DUF4232 domain-containing protein [Rathayibacter sp. VKM Ac-2759]|uniref:DUF4232 domain-containing protein n=1 Tax=Rathayibacter sp. VKM Ac-2759 TaxID=2609252 RepID=UPI0013184088|nr:DUF4232 domain-containing protein [Rathayibacter sp. VKM Ac-2759]QHC66398.1 DUF4232 domain-containing protein [Rathayibacter sp. VKM Ac-2759]